jgi:WD40 repeat protein
MQRLSSWRPSRWLSFSPSSVNTNFIRCPQVAIGTKTGEILLYDLASSSLVESVKAHMAAVWSFHVRPDERALVSGSADKDVKFWELEFRNAMGESVCNDRLYMKNVGSPNTFTVTAWTNSLAGTCKDSKDD